MLRPRRESLHSDGITDQKVCNGLPQQNRPKADMAVAYGTFMPVAGDGTPPLEKLYPSLSDDQKLSLTDAAPQPQNVSLLHAQDQSSENRTNLKVGARVKLRSGGPLMAVLSVRGTDVTCVWFDAVGHAETGTFPAASLM
jgi:uncharacterized protein YodC (DUF2158 family)